MPDANDDFFEEQEAQSRLKSSIVSKYFTAWTRIRHYSAQLAYVDLFSGPGSYADGTDSTPMLVVDKALGDPDLPSKLVLVFNDKDGGHIAELSKRLAAKPGMERFRWAPQVSNIDMSDEAALSRLLVNLPQCPTFYFIDPWGYKGLTRALLKQVMVGDGAECLFFFNYLRVNAALSNSKLEHNARKFFGDEATERLQWLVEGVDPGLREQLIMDGVQDVVRGLGALVPLTFRVCSPNCDRTSHYLIFATKHFKGYSTMREVMAKECILLGQDLPLYEFDPKPAVDDPQLQLWEDEKPDPLEPLRAGLLETFKGQRRSVIQLFEAHSLGMPFLMRHYKTVLRGLEAEGLVLIDPAAEDRPTGTLADSAIVSFRVREAQ